MAIIIGEPWADSGWHAGDGRCPVCDSFVRPATLVRVCDECNYGSYEGRCVICGGPGISDAYYCKECSLLEKDVRFVPLAQLQFTLLLLSMALRFSLVSTAVRPVLACASLPRGAARRRQAPLVQLPLSFPLSRYVCPCHFTSRSCAAATVICYVEVRFVLAASGDVHAGVQRDGCPKIINLGSAKTDLFYERKKYGFKNR